MRDERVRTGSFDIAVSTVLVTLGVLGLMTQMNLLEIHMHLPSGWNLTRWWPLGLVVLGAIRIAFARPEWLFRRTMAKRGE